MRKLLSIQYLRAIAAIGVVIFHSAHNAAVDFRIGEAGVDLFFILSGFIMVAITNAKTRPLDFLNDRIRRIVPVYWVVTAVMIIGSLLGLFPNLRLATSHILCSLMLLPSISPSNGHVWPVVVPGWTLNYEMFFYAVFSMLLLLKSEHIRVWWLTMIFAALSMAGWILHPSNPILATYLDPITLEFAAGALLGYAWKTDRLIRVPPWLPVLVGCGLYGLAILAPYSSVRPIIYGVPAFLIVLGCLLIESESKVPFWRLPLFLGDASYSIYLWHSLGISVLAKLLHAAGHSAAVKVPFFIVGGLVVGSAAYLLIEAPINRLLKEKRWTKGIAVPAGP